MIRSRPPSLPRTGRRPLRKRLTSAACLVCAVALGALAAGALFAPTFVFGSQSGSPHPGPEVVVESGGLSAGQAASQAAGEAGHESGGGAATAAVAGTDEGTLLATLPWGNQPGQVGLAQPQEGLTRGPEALAVAPNGRIAVLDSVNQRVLLLDSSGQVTCTAAVPLSEPRFLAVTNERVYVLDCDHDHLLATLYWSGSLCGRSIVPALPDAVTGLFATSQGPCVEVAHAKVYRITNRPPGKILGDVSDSDDSVLQSADLSLNAVAGRPLASEMNRLVGARFAPGAAPVLTSYVSGTTGVVTQSTNLDLPVPEGRSIEHLLSVDGDLSQGLIVGARLLDGAGPSEPASLLLTRFVLGDDGVVRQATTADGAVDALLLADTSFAYVGLPYTVAPDGRVFQPVATELGYTILVHAFPSADASPETTEVQP